jgi:hypothetical protein
MATAPIAHAIATGSMGEKLFTTPLNPRRRPLGRRPQPECFHSSRRTTIPGQTSRPNDGTSTSPDGLTPPD